MINSWTNNNINRNRIQVGDTFLYFQWDSLVLESGWLMTVVAASGNSPADLVSRKSKHLKRAVNRFVIICKVYLYL